MRNGTDGEAGFTLLEMASILAVGWLLVGSAVPYLASGLRRSRLQSEARTVGLVLTGARMQAMKRGENVIDFTPGKFVDPGLAECHMLGEELGFIKRDGGKLVDRTQYDNLMGTYFQGVTSTASLTPKERAQWAAMLRSWKNARTRKAS